MAYREIDSATYQGKDLLGNTFTAEMKLFSDLAQARSRNFRKDVFRVISDMPIRITSSIPAPVDLYLNVNRTNRFLIEGGGFVEKTVNVQFLLKQGLSVTESYVNQVLIPNRPETFDERGEYIKFENRDGSDDEIEDVTRIDIDYNFNFAAVIPEPPIDYGASSDYSFTFLKRIGLPVDDPATPTVECRIEMHQLYNRRNPVSIEVMQVEPITIKQLTNSEEIPVEPYGASVAEVNLYSETFDKYRRLFSIRDAEVKVLYYEEDELFFEGFSVSGIYAETYSQKPYYSTLTFSDGTNILHLVPFDIPLTSSGLTTNFRVSIYDVLKYIIVDVLQSECDLVVQDGLYYRSAGALRQHLVALEIDTRVYRGLSCYEALVRLMGSLKLQFRKTICTVNGVRKCYWMIKRFNERETNFFVLFPFTTGTNEQGIRNIEIGNTIWIEERRNPPQAKHMNPSISERTVAPVYDAIEVTKKLANIPDIIEYPNFSEDAWERKSQDPDSPQQFEFARRLKEWETNGSLGSDNPKGYLKAQYPVPPVGPRPIVLLYNTATQTPYKPGEDNVDDAFREDEKVYLRHKGIEVIAGARNFITIEIDAAALLSSGAVRSEASAKATADYYNQYPKFVYASLPVEISQTVGDETYIYSANTRSWNLFAGNPDIDRQIDVNDLWRLEFPKIHYADDGLSVDGNPSFGPSYLYNLTISSIPVQYDGTLIITIYDPLESVVDAENLIGVFGNVRPEMVMLLRCDAKYHTDNDLATFEQQTLAEIIRDDEEVGPYNTTFTYNTEIFHTDNEDRGSVSAFTFNGDPVLGFSESSAADSFAPIQEYVSTFFLSRYRKQDRIRKVNVKMMDLLDTFGPEYTVATDDSPLERYKVVRWSYTPVSRLMDNIWELDMEEIKVTPTSPVFTIVTDKRSSTLQRPGGGGAFIDQSGVAISYVQPGSADVEDNYLADVFLENNQLQFKMKSTDDKTVLLPVGVDTKAVGGYIDSNNRLFIRLSDGTAVQQANLPVGVKPIGGYIDSTNRLFIRLSDGTNVLQANLPRQQSDDYVISGAFSQSSQRLLLSRKQENVSIPIPTWIINQPSTAADGVINGMSFNSSTRVLRITTTTGRVFTATIPAGGSSQTVGLRGVTFNTSTRVLTITDGFGQQFNTSIPAAPSTGGNTNIEDTVIGIRTLNASTGVFYEKTFTSSGSFWVTFLASSPHSGGLNFSITLDGVVIAQEVINSYIANTTITITGVGHSILSNPNIKLNCAGGVIPNNPSPRLIRATILKL